MLTISEVWVHPGGKDVVKQFTSQCTGSRGREKGQGKIQCPGIPHRGLLPLARLHLLGFPEPPKVTPTSRKHGLNT